MNTETINLNMTAQEADSLAFLLMTGLRVVTMLNREREDATVAANELFKQLGYGHGTDSYGGRVEWTPRQKQEPQSQRYDTRQNSESSTT